MTAEDLRDQNRNERTLAELRGLRGVSQSELAARMGVQQAAISRLERRSDWRLSTLRNLVVALGGKLELRAHFPSAGTYRIRTVCRKRVASASTHRLAERLRTALDLFETGTGILRARIERQNPTANPGEIRRLVRSAILQRGDSESSDVHLRIKTGSST